MALADNITDLIAVVKVLEELETGFTAADTDCDSVVSGIANDLSGELVKLFKDTGPVSQRRQILARSAEELGARAFEIIGRHIAQDLDRSDIPPSAPTLDIFAIGLRDHMIDNSIVFESRAVTHNAASAGGGNTGTGLHVLISEDDQGTADDLENITDENLTFYCRFAAGQNSILSGNEIFEVRGELPARDVMENGGSGSGIVGTIEVVSATRSNISVITNGDFNQTLGSTASDTDKIPGWTISASATSFTAETAAAATFRDIDGTTAGQAINIAANAKITQEMTNLPSFGPLHVSVMWFKGQAGSDGTLTLRCGGASNTATVSSGTTEVYSQLKLIAYPDDYTSSGTDIEIELSGASTIDVNIDECVVAVPTLIGGRYHVITAGATDFVVGDTFTQDSTITDSGKNLKWLYKILGGMNTPASRNFPFNLPHAGTATVGWTDPA